MLCLSRSVGQSVWFGDTISLRVDRIVNDTAAVLTVWSDETERPLRLKLRHPPRMKLPNDAGRIEITVLTGATFHINTCIKVNIENIREGQGVKFAFTCPTDIPINREEIRHQLREQGHKFIQSQREEPDAPA